MRHHTKRSSGIDNHVFTWSLNKYVRGKLSLVITLLCFSNCGSYVYRGLALGIALTVYGREEEADTLIEQMTRDQDPILRYGGMYALALAYSGTANNKAIRQLLHFAVSDVSDDVRRTAVLALGFVLYSEPEQVSICQRNYVLLATFLFLITL